MRVNDFTRVSGLPVWLLAAVFITAACGSDEDTTASSSGTAGSAGTTPPAVDTSDTTSAGDPAAARAFIEPFLGQRAIPPVPAGSGDGAVLEGANLYYIPVNYSVPVFHVEERAISDAAGHFGATVTTCDGAANPSTMTQCITAAINDDADGVILNTVLPDLVPNAIADLRERGIPVVINGVPTSMAGGDEFLAGQTGIGDSSDETIGRIIANWVIADSEASANVLVIDITISKESHGITVAEVDELEAKCPDCTVTVEAVTTTDPVKIAEIVRAAFLRDPDIDYISAADGMNQGIKEGLRSAQPSGEVRFALLSGGSLSAMTGLQDGSLPGANIGYDVYYAGWADVDQLIRLMSGLDPANGYELPLRLFTEDNVQDLDLSQQNFESTAWYTDPIDASFLDAWNAN